MPEFDPQPNEIIEVSNFRFKVAEHPGAPGEALAETGARATVFQLVQSDGTRVAMKVFKRRFRDPYQLEVARRIEPFANLPGFKAAQRLVITGDAEIAQRYPDLQFSVVMPWVHGITWYAILRSVYVGDRVLQPDHAFHLAWSFLRVMCAAESRSLAHTDIASGNVLFDLDQRSTELIDLEELFAPGFSAPQKLNTGTHGYRHQGPTTVDGLWCAEADRYAAAVLLGEILALASPDAKAMISGETLFDKTEEQQPGPRYEWLLSHLSCIDPRLGDLFKRTWESRHLADCPSATEFSDVFECYVMPRVRTPIGAAMVAPSGRSAWWLPSGIVSSVPPPPPSPLPKAAEALVGWQTIVDLQPDLPFTPVPPRPRRHVQVHTSSAPPPAPQATNAASTPTVAVSSSSSTPPVDRPPAPTDAVVSFIDLEATAPDQSAPSPAFPSFLRGTVIPAPPHAQTSSLPPEPKIPSTVPMATVGAQMGHEISLFKSHDLTVTADAIRLGSTIIHVRDVRVVAKDRRSPGRLLEAGIGVIGLGFLAIGTMSHAGTSALQFIGILSLVFVFVSMFWLRPRPHVVVVIDSSNVMHELIRSENESLIAMVYNAVDSARRTAQGPT